MRQGAPAGSGVAWPVTFFLPGEPSLPELARAEPERDWHLFSSGERMWVLRTFLELRCRGLAVELSDRLPERGTVVFHSKHRRTLRRQWRRQGVVLVGVRADNREPLIADLEIVQNGSLADDKRRFFVPHWPQPGILPRDPARSNSVRRVAFKGITANLHPAFRERSWQDALAARGVDWRVDAVSFAGTATDVAAAGWRDYSDVDVTFAVRPAGRPLHRDKPASKLVNAWLAGTPAILGREIAYRELRRSELDYLEADTPAEALAALDRLLAAPALFEAMAANGLQRAAELDVGAVADRWQQVLWDLVPGAADRTALKLLRPLPLVVRQTARHALRLLSGRPLR